MQIKTTQFLVVDLWKRENVHKKRKNFLLGLNYMSVK